MGNKSQQMELIQQMCRSRDLDVGYTFKVSRRLLESYRNALWLHGGFSGIKDSILKAEGKDIVMEWYLRLKDLTKEEMSGINIDSMIFNICRTEWIICAINSVMEKVRAFHRMGELYYDILIGAYFSTEQKTDLELVEDLALERSTYYRRKKEAVILCGVLLW